MRKLLPLLAALLLPAAAGCLPGKAARPVDVSLAPAPVIATPDGAPLAPGRDRAAELLLPRETPLVGGFDWGMWGPFPEDATLPVDLIAFGGGCIFYVPGFAVGAVASLLLFPFPGMGIGTFLWLPDDVGDITGMVGYYALGIPFYAIQKIVWDAPCAFSRFLRLHCRSAKGQVEWLIPRVDDSPYGREVYEKLRDRTGEDFGSREAWEKWWDANRDRFDDDMKPARPAEKKPAPAN